MTGWDWLIFQLPSKNLKLIPHIFSGITSCSWEERRTSRSVTAICVRCVYYIIYTINTVMNMVFSALIEDYT